MKPKNRPMRLTAGARPAKRRQPPGHVPGSLAVDQSAPEPRVTLTVYDASRLEHGDVADVGTLEKEFSNPAVSWIAVHGLGSVPLLQRLQQIFQLHPLAMEDVVNLYQRPKVEDYANHLYVVARVPVAVGENLRYEQVSFFLGKGFLVTFHETPHDCFRAIRERLQRHAGVIRGQDADYLLYAMLDALIDSYFPVLEEYGNRIDALEAEILASPTPNAIFAVHAIKQEILALRRAVWPLRDAMAQLLRNDAKLFAPETLLHLRDCYDHTVQLLDLIETDRDLAGDLHDLYLSLSSQRLNEVMKLLTIVSVVFTPLNLIGAIYGMNFDTTRSPWNMPELGWTYGYPFALVLMLTVAVTLLLIFHRQGWIGRK